MLLALFPLLSVIIAALGVLAAYLGWRFLATDEEGQRLRHYVLQPKTRWDDQADALSFRRHELRGALTQRLLLPWFQRLGAFFGRLTPARATANLGRQLSLAGNPLGLRPREFYGLQLLFIGLSFWMALGLLRGAPADPAIRLRGRALTTPAVSAGSERRLNLNRLITSGLALYIGTQFPKQWLRARVRARQKKLRKNLPDALDMLSVCAEAGLGFDQALQRVSERWKTPLGAELARVVTEMQMGVSRPQALRNLADRLEVPEVSSFVSVIVQSDQLGMSITQTLRSQAEQMRVERRHRAQEEARTAPLKMLFPMLFLIMPAMGAVIVGPVIPVIGELFETIGRNTR